MSLFKVGPRQNLIGPNTKAANNKAGTKTNPATPTPTAQQHQEEKSVNVSSMPAARTTSQQSRGGSRNNIFMNPVIGAPKLPTSVSNGNGGGASSPQPGVAAEKKEENAPLTRDKSL